MSRILSVLHAMSDNGNALLSKFIVYAGVSGSSVGIANKVAESTGVITEDYLTLADWGAIVGIIGGLSLAVKSLSGVYFDYQKNKRERLEFEREQGDK